MRRTVHGYISSWLRISHFVTEVWPSTWIHTHWETTETQNTRSGTSGSAVYFCLPNNNPMYIQYLREMVPPSAQNTVGVCNWITLLILYYISSRLVTILKVTDALYMFLIFLVLLLVSSSSILAFRHSFFLFLKCLLFSHLTVFQSSTFLWLGFCNHCILACFLWSR